MTPPGDGLEPVNSGALRSDIVVNDQERQTVIGYGWGAGGHEGEINALAKRFEQKLFDGLNCKVIRLHNSQATHVRQRLQGRGAARAPARLPRALHRLHVPRQEQPQGARRQRDGRRSTPGSRSHTSPSRTSPTATPITSRSATTSTTTASCSAGCRPRSR